MERTTIIEQARRAAGLSQLELSYRSHTPQSAISDYERRRKSPTLSVVERLLAAANADLLVIPLSAFEEHEAPEVGRFFVPDRVPMLLPPLCFDRVRLRMEGQSTRSPRVWDLSVRAERIRAYELVLCHGGPGMILECVDGALLADAWLDLELPDPVRTAWQPLVEQAVRRRGAPMRDLR